MVRTVSVSSGLNRMGFDANSPLWLSKLQLSNISVKIDKKMYSESFRNSPDYFQKSWVEVSIRRRYLEFSHRPQEFSHDPNAETAR